jgi:hypothetical protein
MSINFILKEDNGTKRGAHQKKERTHCKTIARKHSQKEVAQMKGCCKKKPAGGWF